MPPCSSRAARRRQGLTEFLPVSSTAHLLIGERLLGFEDPGGVFTVMIQLGSILAIMWLYRAKILAVIAGLPIRAGGAAFRADAARRVRCPRSSPARCSSDFVEARALREHGGDRARRSSSAASSC